MTSKLIGQDANWDLQNYHFYDPWAWLNGRLYAWDIAAAQLQSYHNPLPDVPFYLMVAADWRPRTIAFVLAIPTGIAAFFLLKLLPLLFRDRPERERWLATIGAATVGLTSAMGRGVIGSTMNEWPGTALTITAIWMIVRALAHVPGAALAPAALLGAGLLCGLATGAKLTFGVFAVGLCAAILLRGPWQRASAWRAIREAFVFGVAVVAGTAITAGPWMWALWAQFHNPIFPYGNEWFKSPWWYEVEALRRQYGPHNIVQWLEFPFRLAAPRTGYVAEVEYKDPRLAALYALALLAAASWISQRIALRISGAPTENDAVERNAEIWRVVGIFWVTSFLVWTAVHSIYRYLVPLDLLSGALIVALLRYLLQPRAALPVTAIACVVLVVWTQPPDWSRIDFAHRWFKVPVPPVESNALVLLTTDAPMAYVLPFFPADARHLGLKNNMNNPGSKTLIEVTIARTISEHRGPLYSLSHPPGEGTAALDAHGLARIPGACSNLWTNMPTRPIELCRLERIATRDQASRDGGAAGAAR